MSFSFASIQALPIPISVSSSSRKNKLQFRKTHDSLRNCVCEDETGSVNRRNISLGLAGALMTLTANDQSAKAAGKRTPPPPPQEKKDPSMTGLQAKVMASKKRREAMKEEMARLRERGKPVSTPSQ